MIIIPENYPSYMDNVEIDKRIKRKHAMTTHAEQDLEYYLAGLEESESKHEMFLKEYTNHDLDYIEQIKKTLEDALDDRYITEFSREFLKNMLDDLLEHDKSSEDSEGVTFALNSY